jgi:hypothetical protein
MNTAFFAVIKKKLLVTGSTELGALFLDEMPSPMSPNPNHVEICSSWLFLNNLVRCRPSCIRYRGTYTVFEGERM